jgi:hypothetical protein
MTVKDISYVAIEESEELSIRQRLPSRIGDTVDRATLGGAAKVARDACLTFKNLVAENEVSIRITAITRCHNQPFIQDPEIVRRVEPDYPTVLQEAGVKGTVGLTILIGLDGIPRDFQVVSGDPALVELAVDAVSQWRYRPAYSDTEPIELRKSLSFGFGMPLAIAR